MCVFFYFKQKIRFSTKRRAAVLKDLVVAIMRVFAVSSRLRRVVATCRCCRRRVAASVAAAAAAAAVDSVLSDF